MESARPLTFRPPLNYNLNASTTLNGGIASQPLYAKFGRKASVEDRFVGVSSMYNSLQVKLDKRFSHGFAMTTSYTFGKAMGYGGGDEVGYTFYATLDSRQHLVAHERRAGHRLRHDRDRNSTHAAVRCTRISDEMPSPARSRFDARVIPYYAPTATSPRAPTLSPSTASG